MAIVVYERYIFDETRRQRKPKEYASTALYAAQAALLGNIF